MEEEWRDVPGWEGLYQVSNMGRVRSLPRTVTTPENRVRSWPGQMMKLGPMSRGYSMVQLSQNGTSTPHLVHRLVAKAFVSGADECRTDVNHIDGCRTNNRSDNLEWCTRQENAQHRVRINKIKLDELDVIWARGMYFRRILNQQEIAKSLGVSQPQVSRVIKRCRWKEAV